MYVDVALEHICDFSIMDIVLLEDGLQPAIALMNAKQIRNFLEEAGHRMDVADRLNNVGLVEDDHANVAQLANFLVLCCFHDNKS